MLYQTVRKFARGLLLVCVELVVVLRRADVHLVLRLRLRWLERAGEDSDFRILYLTSKKPTMAARPDSPILIL